MSGTPPVLVAVIELLIAYHPKVLRILLGEYEPTLLELAEIVRNASEPDERARVASGSRSKQLAALMRGESIQDAVDKLLRSEERRVGKECRSRWSPYH